VYAKKSLLHDSRRLVHCVIPEEYRRDGSGQAIATIIAPIARENTIHGNKS
jgi:hypothetical protein